MKHLLFIALFFVVSVAQAGQCFKAYKESKKLEKIVILFNNVSEIFIFFWLGKSFWSAIMAMAGFC